MLQQPAIGLGAADAQRSGGQHQPQRIVVGHQGEAEPLQALPQPCGASHGPAALPQPGIAVAMGQGGGGGSQQQGAGAGGLQPKQAPLQAGRLDARALGQQGRALGQAATGLLG